MIQFQQLRPDKFTLAVQVDTHRDNYTHTVVYSSLEQAHANAERDIAEVTRLAHLRAEFQDAMDKLPGLHEHTAHLDANVKRIVVNMTSHHPDGQTFEDRFPFTQVFADSVDEISGIHARHMEHLAAHKAKLTDNAAKLSFLKGLK